MVNSRPCDGCVLQVGYGDVLLQDRFSRSFGIMFLLVGCACWTYLLTSVGTHTGGAQGGYMGTAVQMIRFVVLCRC